MNSNEFITRFEKLEVLDEIKEVFYQNTGLVISIYYTSNGRYDFYPAFKENQICNALHQTEAGFKRCTKCDKEALDKAKEQKAYCIYRCHAGFTNVVIPIEYKGIDIGAIYTGQLFTEKPSMKMFNQYFNDEKCPDINYQDLQDVFLNSQVVSEEKLTFGVKLLEVMANYILSIEDKYFLQKEIFMRDREIMEHENRRMRLENELKNLRISVLEYDKDKGSVSQKLREGKNVHKISKAQIFIRDNYYKNIKLMDVAEAVYLSKNYFSSYFKEITGYTFSFYLTKTRLKAAKKLLIETDLPIKEIVFKTGFEDYNYFNRLFKQVEGIPPAKFRMAAGRV